MLAAESNPLLPPFRCSNPALYEVVLYGSSFGASTAVAPGGVALADDGVARLIEFGTTFVDPLTGANSTVWDTTATSFLLGAWDHTRIVLYTSQVKGIVRVTLTTPAPWGDGAAPPPPQVVLAAFEELSPSVVGIGPPGAITNVPGTGGLLPLSLDVVVLNGAQDVIVTVGGVVCPLIDDSGALLGGPPSVSAYIAAQAAVQPPPGKELTFHLRCNVPAGQVRGMGRSHMWPDTYSRSGTDRWTAVHE